jgi:hypothetical protein
MGPPRFDHMRLNGAVLGLRNWGRIRLQGAEELRVRGFAIFGGVSMGFGEGLGICGRNIRVGMERCTFR